MSHGGKRPGSGPHKKKNPLVQLCIRVPYDVRKYLEAQPKMGRCVTETIRRSKAFKDWERGL